MDIKPSEDLAEFAATCRFDDLPASAQMQARNLLLDSIASALTADYGQETPLYTTYARTVGGAGDSTVIGSGERLSLLGASLLNGWMIMAATICDTYVPAHVHITPEIVPPALGIAEQGRLNGKALLGAIAIGAEVAVRVAIGIDYSVVGPRGWHMPGIVGPFGAAAAVGRLRGLSKLQMRNALGLAGSQSAGTWASWGTPTVKFHQSRGAVSGLLAGLLAKQNLTSSSEILAHPDGGIFQAYSDGGKPEAVIAGLGERFEFERISFRLWPGGTPLQPAMTAMFDLIAAHRPAFDAIEKVRIEIAPDVYEAHARFAEPKGTFEALLSHPSVMAVSLRNGQFWLDTVDPDKTVDDKLKRFMAKQVELVANPDLTRERSLVEVAMIGGEKFQAEAKGARGTPDNPATASDLHAKFERAAAGRLSAAETSELFDLLMRIDELSDLDRLFALLRTPSTRGAAS